MKVRVRMRTKSRVSLGTGECVCGGLGIMSSLKRLSLYPNRTKP